MVAYVTKPRSINRVPARYKKRSKTRQRNELQELGRKYHIDPRISKRYAESPQRSEYTLSERKPSKLEEDLWLEDALYPVVRILEKQQGQCFEEKYIIVKKYVRGKKGSGRESGGYGLR